MQGLFLLLTLFMILPIYIITIKECYPNQKRTKYILATVFNPSSIYVISIILTEIEQALFSLSINPYLELANTLISSIFCLGVFILLFDKKKKNIGIDCFIYISCVLIEFTSISTLLLKYSLLETIISCIILPLSTYIAYYFIVIKKLKIIMKELKGSDGIILNILPCLASILVLGFSFIGSVYIDNNNAELMHRYNMLSVLINYMLLVFEFIAYYIIFNNAHKQYNLRKANKQIIKNQEQVINAFSMVIENSSELTGDHVKRVSEYSYILAKALGYNEHDANNLKIASMLHDVGKVYVPNEILEKPGKLTDEEFDIVKSHVTKGEELLHNIDGELIDLSKIIALEHHEKWNGKGYLGISGEDIHLESRIVAVADVFDALMSKRSYKDAWTLDDAYKLILSESGQHFDPQVVLAFKNNFGDITQIYKKFAN